MSSKQQLDMLAKKQCRPCRADESVIDEAEVTERLGILCDWQLDGAKKQISCGFSFENFEQTMTFVNKLARIAEVNDHHPDVSFGYNYCQVVYTTHSIGGLSENDFICAAQLEKLFLEMKIT